jgi:hypothetical protein
MLGFAPISALPLGGLPVVLPPGELSGSASVSITATGALTAAGACSAWAGQWQGQWQGKWGGCIQSGAAGSMVGLAVISIEASGTLTNGAKVESSGGGAYSSALWLPRKPKPVEDDEALLLALLM